MNTSELRDLLEVNIPKLGCSDIQLIEDEIEQRIIELKELTNAKTKQQVNFYRMQLQARTNYILKIILEA